MTRDKPSNRLVTSLHLSRTLKLRQVLPTRVSTAQGTVRDKGHATVRDYTVLIQMLRFPLGQCCTALEIHTRLHPQLVRTLMTYGAVVVSCRCINCPTKTEAVRECAKKRSAKKIRADEQTETRYSTMPALTRPLRRQWILLPRWSGTKPNKPYENVLAF